MAEAASAVGSIFGAKNLFKNPKPPEAPPPVTTATPAVQGAVAKTVQARNRARGYRSTILSQQFMAPAQPMPQLKDTMGA